VSRQCPQCRRIMDFTVASCDGCQLSFFSTPSKPKDLTEICVKIAAAAFAASGLIVAILSRY
jgi:hypothetical protein